MTICPKYPKLSPVAMIGTKTHTVLNSLNSSGGKEVTRLRKDSLFHKKYGQQ
ncbi:hypothetical protein SAMN04488082_12041 [Desulfomicrobium apsheronum]|uniref:Uncharacterized protein n=1 Tax=Desulfomicrobium apsheronum TaxID=52560 RepID=A0A1I3YKE6_9BACT|nr:hypothetical protein SAMN04488082_12041 [Desulfomicrobium apsheronum]